MWHKVRWYERAQRCDIMGRLQARRQSVGELRRRRRVQPCLRIGITDVKENPCIRLRPDDEADDYLL